MSLEQNSMVQTYLDAVCSQIKWREVHEQVKSELVSHLEEIALELKSDGMSDQEAIPAAIHRMGEATDLGWQFQQTHKPQRNWPLVVAVTLLSCLGLTVMHMLDTSSVLGSLNLFVKSMIFTGIGTALLLWLNYYDFRKLRPYTAYLFGGTIVLWLVVLMLGPSLNGKSFLTLGPVFIGGNNHNIFFNYIGITPFFLTLALAGIFIGRDWTNRSWIIKAFFLLIIPNSLYMISGTAYLAVVYTLVFLVLMGMSNAPKKWITGFLLMSAGLAMIKLSLATDNLSFQNLLDIAELWGKNISTPDATPTEFHTGFIFFYLVEKFGLLLGAGTIAIGCAITLVLVRAVRQIKDQYGRMVVAGLTAYFAVNFYWHVLMSLGMAPFASVNLPFVSFGGSQTIVNLAATGAILSIYKRKNLIKLTR